MAWNKPSAAPKPQPKKPSAMRGIAAGLVVVAVAVACIVIFMGKDGDVTVNKSEKKPTKIKTVTPAPPTPKVKPETPKPEKPAIKKPDCLKKKFSEMTSEEKHEAMLYWAKTVKDGPGLDMRTRVPPPLLSNTVQNAILPYFEPGAEVIPMGRIRDEQARKAIDTEIIFNFDDTDDVLEKKQFVKETLADLKKFMDAGGTATEYFEKLDARQNLEYTAMASCKEEVLKYRRSGDEEMAKVALETCNKYLREKGLPELHMATHPLRPRKIDLNQTTEAAQEAVQQEE